MTNLSVSRFTTYFALKRLLVVYLEIVTKSRCRFDRGALLNSKFVENEKKL